MSSDMDTCAIRVERLGKQYQLGLVHDKHKTLAETVVGALASPARKVKRAFSPLRQNDPSTIWALKDVTLSIRPGEVVGVIGRNGAGKSTFLKILSGITDPSTGSAQIRGRVGSLLEVGTGFHPELTGRENVYLNGAILGMARSEIRSKFDAIVDFAEVARFIDTPVKRYSSGMRLRLAFSVAAHLQTDILLIDEVLAVGDASFQQKCMDKMSEVAHGGRSILFVSHNMSAIRSLCGRAILLTDGQITADDAPDKVIAEYLSPREQERSADFVSLRRQGTGKVRFTAGQILDEKGDRTETIGMGDSFTLHLDYECELVPRSVDFRVRLHSLLDEGLIEWFTGDAVEEPVTLGKRGSIHLSSGPLNLLPGNYGITVAAGDGYAEQFDLIEDALRVEILDTGAPGLLRTPSNRRAVIFSPAAWTFEIQDDV